jgi:outer membrane lipopolysaccharide assembly protein LptE/RlpB
MIDHHATYLLYPNVVSIDDEAGAFDKDGNIVEIDMEAVSVKVLELKSEYEIQQQEIQLAKQAALNKLMALGLTEEEALALGK